MTDQSTVESPQPAVPRWVVKAAEAVGWEPAVLMGQIDELLYDGWQPSKVRAKLEIPEQQERSLEQYATKYRYRRVIAPMTRIRETLVAGAEPLSLDCMKLIRLVMDQALGGGVESAKLEKTAEIMLAFLDRVERIGQRAEDRSEPPAGKAVTVEVTDKRLKLSDEAIQAIRDVYGIAPDDGSAGVS